MDERFANQISGSVERITFYNEENGYTVLRLKPDSRAMLAFKYASGREALITVVGNLPEVNPGEWLKLSGRWSHHSKHGRQFQVERCEQSLPATTEGIKRYLGSGLVRGVGRVMAERIVETFGLETLAVIEEAPGRLRDVPGIGPKRAGRIERAWEEQKAIKDVMIFLQSHGVTTGLATKIYKKYGDESLTVVRQTPYRLVQDIHGIGFKTADQIAQALGLARDDPGRIEAGIAYTLNRLADEGHVYVPRSELVPEAAAILDLDQSAIQGTIERLSSDELIKQETLHLEPAGTGEGTADSEEAGEIVEAVYLTPLYYAEIGVTNRLWRLLAHPLSRLASLGAGVAGLQLPLVGLQLSESQQAAVRTALSQRVTILTGGPGTGKTTTLRTLLEVLDQNGRTYALASPTGRAAKRLAEATDRPARTIHRLLEFKPGEGFGRHEENPIEADMVVIDEASMLDLVLANSLLKAIAPGSHLLLVGDVDQLPSVGAGDVLRDLIASGVAAMVRLSTIFRQAANSLIISNAHRINQGQFPQTRPEATDFFLFVKDDPEAAADLLVDVVGQRAPARFGLDALDDIQVLSPMYQGPVGVTSLNQRLQQALNPPGRQQVERRLSGRVFRVGDKVMQTVNNYDKSVYNGDIGRITAMDPIGQTLTVSIDGLPVVYDYLEADELVHAFAISVHKSQGSEYPCVVIPMLTSHYLMLQRNLLYTAVTRARKVVILVGTRRAIRLAVRNNRVARRHTALDYRLRSGRRKTD